MLRHTEKMNHMMKLLGCQLHHLFPTHRISQLYAAVKHNGDILSGVYFEKKKQLFKHLRLGSLSEQCSFMI